MRSNQKRVNLPILVYVLLFLISLTVFSLYAIKGMHISAYWGRGMNTVRLDPSMINGVEIISYKCPMFFDEKEGAEISLSIKNKDDRRQDAGVVLLLSKRDVEYQQEKIAERMKLQAGEERSFSWRVDSSNLVDDKVSLRLLLAQSPDHPAHSSRACLILPWQGPFSVSFMNTGAYPLLILLFLLSAVWIYFKSGLDWENRKRFFFFLFANVIILLMCIFLLMKFYMMPLISMAFLVIGIVATLQKSPYISVDEYKKYIKS